MTDKELIALGEKACGALIPHDLTCVVVVQGSHDLSTVRHPCDCFRVQALYAIGEIVSERDECEKALALSAYADMVAHSKRIAEERNRARRESEDSARGDSTT